MAIDTEETGYYIKKLRQKYGITVTALSKIVNVSKEAIWLWEQGKKSPDVTSILKLAVLYDMDIKNIIKRK